MANSYFQFKEFKVDQGNCGMKVTTEACLFGALVTEWVVPNQGRILDIGAGTGLLSLMLAQNFRQSSFTGVEIDKEAFNQASENFVKSPWAKRLKMVNQSVQDFAKVQKEQFNLIICNPPFYHQHQKGNNSQKAKAIHSDTLPQDELIEAVEGLLDNEGEFYVILPLYEAELLTERCSKYGLKKIRSVIVYNRVGDEKVFRVINQFKRIGDTLDLQQFHIRDADGNYSSQFIELLKPFYLYL